MSRRCTGALKVLEHVLQSVRHQLRHVSDVQAWLQPHLHPFQVCAVQSPSKDLQCKRRCTTDLSTINIARSSCAQHALKKPCALSPAAGPVAVIVWIPPRIQDADSSVDIDEALLIVSLSSMYVRQSSRDAGCLGRED